MDSLELDSVWRDADIARKAFEPTLDSGEYLLDSLLVPRDDAQRAELASVSNGERVIPLPNGDYHVCLGTQCKFAFVDADRQLICSKTGFQVGSDMHVEVDSTWTGRSTTSANPDDVGGTPVGGWVKRRDMFAASQAAFSDAAERFIDVEPVYVPDSKELAAKEKKAAPKRGALCVDEIRENQPAKRTRVSKKSALSLDTRRKMELEAVTVINKLITRIVGTASKSRGVGASDIRAQAAAAVASNGTEKAPDPRLQNLEFVRNAALKRMFKTQVADRRSLSLDGVHNLCVYVNAFVRGQRKLAEAYNTRVRNGQVATGETEFTGRNRTLSAKHIVALWAACCKTPYIAQNARSTDSFRPFASGVLYTLKRGLKLRNGMEIIPSLPELAAQLPCLRSQQATPAAKQLQSSSHKGVCSLHRSISSIENASSAEQAQIYEAFQSAVSAGESLKKNVRGG